MGLLSFSQIMSSPPTFIRRDTRRGIASGARCVLRISGGGTAVFADGVAFRLSSGANPANFYGPIGLLGLNETDDNPNRYDVSDPVVDFWFYFLRSGYSGVDKQEGVGWADKIEFAATLADDMLWQFTPIGFAFVVLGFLTMLRSRYQWLCLSMVCDLVF